MSDQSKLGLGHIITTEQHRDAIHVAIAPVVAAHTLIAGRHVALDDKGKASEHTGKPAIGIIDPFLGKFVEAGQACWMFLYPGSITSLRHEWAHPAFAKDPFRTTDDGFEISKAWVTEYAKEHRQYSDPGKAYDDFMRDVRDGYIQYTGSDMHSADECDDLDELLKHLSVILGRPCTEGDFGYSCGC